MKRPDLAMTPYPERLSCEVSHLRFLARQIVDRGTDSPPLDVQRQLQPMLPFTLTKEGERRLIVTLLEEAASEKLAGLDDEAAEVLMKAVPLVHAHGDRSIAEIRRDPAFKAIYDRLESRRRGSHALRWVGPPEMLFAADAIYAKWQEGRQRRIMQWVSWCRDQRYALGPGSVARLDHLADVVERIAGIDSCLPRLGRAPPGKWRSVVHGLVMKVDVSSEFIVARMSEEDRMEMDFITRRIHPPEFDFERDRILLERCGEYLRQAAARLGETLRVARLSMRLLPDRRPMFEVTLEAWASGDRIEARMRATAPLTYTSM